MTTKEKIDEALKSVDEETNFEVIAEMKAAMNAVYGEEKNQILKPSYETIMSRAEEVGFALSIKREVGQLEQKNVYSYLKRSFADCVTYHIIIHFPEVKITNGHREHLIRNMFVRLFVKPNGTVFTHMQGIRTTLTEAELMSHYVHSHLPRFEGRVMKYHNFCLGVGEINQVLAILNTKFTSANFMMLLMHIKNFLEWESKEGHPYMFLENVFKRGHGGSYELPEHLALSMVPHLINQMRSVFTVEQMMRLFTYTVGDKGIEVKSTLEGEKEMANIIRQLDPNTLLNSNYPIETWLSLRDSLGRYYPLPIGRAATSAVDERPILVFKGTEFKLEIIERQNTQENETFANPKVTTAACKELSRLTSKVALTTPGIRTGSALNYNTRFAKSDQVPV